MSEVGIHKFYCTPCRVYIFGETALRLALNFNSHNAVHHPLDGANWTGPAIVRSMYYLGPGLPNLSPETNQHTLPEYTVPHGTSSKLTWGDAKNPPNITDADRKWLKDEAKVKWD